MMNYCGRGFGNNFGYGMMHGGGFGMMLFWIALLGLVIYLIVKYFHRSPNYRPLNSHHKTAMDILKERYAKGEISEEEFEEKRKRLHQEL